MVRRVIEAVYKEIRGLHQAAYVLAVFALGSQLLALVRDRLFASEFGAGAELDIYYSAFRVPDLLYVLFASTLSVYVLIPFITQITNEKGEGAAKELLSQVFSIFLVTYSALALVLVVFAPQVTSVVFPGFSEVAQGEVASMMRILLLQPLFLGVSSLLGVVTQLRGRFILYALSPLLYNIGIICGLVFFYPFLGLVGLGVGVVFGAILHIGIQIPYVLGSGLVPVFTKTFDRALLFRVLRVSVPRALTLSMHQIVFLAMIGIASIMTVGSVSVFQLAYNLQSVPLAIIGVSYSVAAFPTLSRLFSKGERTAFVDHVFSALRHILFWSVPIAALIVVLRAQLVRVVLGTGAFNWDDTRLTAAALALFSISLIAQAVNLLIVRAFYAAGNTRVPLVVTVCSSLLSIILALFFYTLFTGVPSFAHTLETLFRVSEVPGTEVLALPLGFTIALLLHTIVLITLFNRMQHIRLSKLTGSFLRSLAAGIMAGVGAYVALNVIVDGLNTETFMGIFLQGCIGGLVGLAAAVALLYVARSPELFEVAASFKRKVKKSEVVTPQGVDDPSV